MSTIPVRCRVERGGGRSVTALSTDLYSSGLRSVHADLRATDAWRVRYADGRCVVLPLHKWCGYPDDADREVLSRCAEPTLDVGCGPGRLVAALAAEGRQALGVDIARSAVQLARHAGAAVVRRSVFDALPAEGTWSTVLLIDGNIGIGGDPVKLLQRCHQLLVLGGTVIVEFDPPQAPTAAQWVRIEDGERRSEWFRWAHVSVDHAEPMVHAAGLRVVDIWHRAGRWFGCLEQ